MRYFILQMIERCFRVKLFFKNIRLRVMEQHKLIAFVFLTIVYLWVILFYVRMDLVITLLEIIGMEGVTLK